MGTLIERLELLIDASTDGAVSGLKKTSVETDLLAGKFPKLSSALDKMGYDSSALGTALTSGVAAGAAVAGAALLSFAVKGVKAFLDATAGVRAFQRVTLSSAEDASRLVFAFEHLGISSDNASSAMGRFAKGIATGSFEAEKFNVAIARNRDGTVDLDGTLINLSDRFNGMTDATLRAELGSAAFGKSWQSLIPVLAQGRDGLKDIFDLAEKDHKVFSQKDLDDGKNFSIAMKELKSAVSGLSIELGKGLVPALTQTAKTATDAVHALDQLTGPIGGIGGAIGKATNLSPITQFQKGFDALSDAVGGRGSVAFKGMDKEAIALSKSLDKGKDSTDTLTGSQDRSADQFVKSAAELKKLTKEFEKHEKAIRDSQNALDGLIGSQLSMDAALYAVQDSEHQLAEERAKGKENFEEIRKAELDYKEKLVAGSQAIRDKVAEENKALGAAKAMTLATQEQIGWLSNMADTLSPGDPLRQFLLGYIEDLKKTTGTFTAKVTVDTSSADYQLSLYKQRWGDVIGGQYKGYIGPSMLPVEGRASGGPVGAGQLYRVNENGMEYFRPSVDGTVIPMGGGGASAPSGDIVIKIGEDAIARISRRAALQDARAGRSWS